MYTVDKYKEMINSNLNKQSDVLISHFEQLKSINFASKVKMLLIVSSLGEPKISLNLTTMEDMFNGIDSDEINDGFAGRVKLTDDFLFNEWKSEEALKFYVDNDLEDCSIEEIAGWVKECFDKIHGEEILLPIYFTVHDESYYLDVKLGEWLAPEEIEL